MPVRLHEHRDAAYLAQRLTRIACDMPLAFTHDDLRRRPPVRWVVVVVPCCRGSGLL